MSDDADTAPHDIQHEREVLAAILVDPKCLDDVASVLVPDDFHEHRNQLVMSAFLALDEDGKSPDDVPNVMAYMGDHSLMEPRAVGEYMNWLTSHHGTTSNVRAYAERVRQLAVRRRILSACREAEELATDRGTDLEVVCDRVDAAVARATSTGRAGGGLERIGHGASETLSDIEAARKNDGRPPGGLQTMVLPTLDHWTCGLHAGDVMVLAARPGKGKTSLGLQMSGEVACGGKKVAFFALEMPTRQLRTKLLAQRSGICLSRLKAGRLSEGEWSRLPAIMDQIKQLPLYVDDASSATPEYIRSRCRELAKLVGGIDLVVIDYLQLMTTRGRHENTNAKVQHISRALKCIAKDVLHCPILLLSQMNRSSEKDKRKPELSDLRDSGAIEQDADIVAFLWELPAERKLGPDEPREVHMMVKKHRNGPTGTIRTRFDPPTTTFQEVQQ